MSRYIYLLQATLYGYVSLVFRDTVAPDIYTCRPPLSLNYALPIYRCYRYCGGRVYIGGSATGRELVMQWPRGKWNGQRIVGFEIKVISSEEPTSELQSLMRLSYTAFCLKKKINTEL